MLSAFPLVYVVTRPEAGSQVDSDAGLFPGLAECCMFEGFTLLEAAAGHNPEFSAPAHLISSLPRDWAAEMATDSAIVRLRKGITVGFVKDGVFLTREQAAEL